MKLFDLLGREVATLVDERQTAGYHQIAVDGRGLANGIYFYRMTAGTYAETKRMILLK